VLTQKAGKSSGASVRSRFLAGLCFLCYCSLFPVLPAKSQVYGGILVVSNVVCPGYNTFDSFDSSTNIYSLWHSNFWFQGHNFGTYTNTLRNDQVVIGADGNITSTVGGCSVYGYLDTGPASTNNFDVHNNSVGGLGWIGPNPQNPFNIGIEPGHLLTNMNLVFDDVVLPTPINSLYNPGTGYPNGNWLSPAFFSFGTNIGGNTYYYLVTNVNGLTTSPSNKVYYALPNIANNRASIFIDASNCVLLLTNGITMKSGDNLTLNSTNNANVEIYTGGTFDTGNGAINNAYPYAPTFKIYGLPSCTSIIFPANANLTAWVYAPEASVKFNGGGAMPHDIVGAFTCHDLTLPGHMNFHFDQVFSANLPFPPTVDLSPTNLWAAWSSNAYFISSTTGYLPMYYQWYFNQTNLIAADTNLPILVLTNVQLTNQGYYFLIVTNLYGSATSAVTSLRLYFDPTPTLTVDPDPTNGGFQFDILGVTGLNYSVEASSNLVDWVPLQTNISPFTFIDTNSTAFPQRFYRSSWVHIYP
jgi:hypothetical protein